MWIHHFFGGIDFKYLYFFNKIILLYLSDRYTYTHNIQRQIIYFKFSKWIIMMTQSHTLLIQRYFVTDNICMANKWLFLLKNTYKTKKYRHIHKIQKISDHSASKILMSSFWKGQYTSFAECTHILTYMHTFYLIYMWNLQ